MEVDERFLREVGLSAMPEEQRQAFLDYVQEELEVRVGEEIAAGMTEEKMREFEEAANDEETKAWLEKNKPNYRELVAKTVEELKEEISRNKEKILA
ncbi:hypothetical protein IKF74_01220 [Candidatus Saccharibacteria bacterium]|nr:hypothetical protein [Candidatus Saccharibacteria bacterium]